jgi:carbamoyltransferase
VQFPFLYFVDPVSRSTREVGPLFFMIGNTYHSLCQRFSPFDVPVEWPHTLALAGKIMAYVALGRTDAAGLGRLRRAYELAVARIFPRGASTPSAWSEATGHRVLAEIAAALDLSDLMPADAIATVHEFLGTMLVENLERIIHDDGAVSANLCLTGGCALNIKWNSLIRETGRWDQVWVPPFPNDAGSAIGAACCELFTTECPPFLDWTAYRGPALLSTEPRDGWTQVPCSIPELAHRLATVEEPIVFLSGRAELGPRALGNRSIIAPATSPHMRDQLNLAKGRESYRPVAPVCLADHVGAVFNPGLPDPFMVFEQQVRPEWRDRIPAICHADGSARVQSVRPDDNPLLYELLAAYHSLTGIPVLCNTSANHAGKGFFPDVASAMDWGRVNSIWSDLNLYESKRPY